MRFTIRDLMWLTVVVGMGCVIAVGYRDLARLRSELKESAKEGEYLRNHIEVDTALEKAYTEEIFKLSGKRVTVTGGRIDPDSEELIFKIQYDNEH